MMKFTFKKYVTGVEKLNFGYNPPKTYIIYKDHRIGYILGGDVYFYITNDNNKPYVDPKISDKGFHVIPYKVFTNQTEAKTYIDEHTIEIWDSLDIYHPLKIKS